MPHWSLDELRAKLVRMQNPEGPSLLAERLGVDTLRLVVENPAENGVALRLVNDGTEVCQIVLRTHSRGELRPPVLDALHTLAPMGVRTDACAIFWSFMASRTGQGFGLLLAAVGAAWAADRGLAITGGAGLIGAGTSEDARATYRRLGTLLPHVTLDPDPDRYTMGQGLLAGPSGEGYRLPEEQEALDADLHAQRGLIAFLQSVPKTKAFNVVAADRIATFGPLSQQGRDHLDYWAYKASRLASENPPDWMDAAWVESNIEDTLGILRADLQRSELSGLLTTRYHSPLTVLFGAPLRGVLTGRLAPRRSV